MKKFKIVKLYGLKPKVVIAPKKKGAKNTTINLLSKILVKLNLKSFFLLLPLHYNLYF